jgi:type I restriction enzyme S subunit
MKNWRTASLGSLCNIEIGKTPYRKNKAFWDVDKHSQNVWLSIADLTQASDLFIVNSREYVSDVASKNLKIVREGALLLSFKLTLGRLAFAGRDLFTNEAIAAITPNDSEELSKFYLYWFLRSIDWDAQADGDEKVKGKTLNKAKLKALMVSFPPLSEQLRIVSILDECYKAIDQAKANTERNLKNVRELFESYLQGVFENRGDRWEERTIGEICKLINGRAYKKEELLSNGKYRVLRVGNFFTNNQWYYSNLELEDDKYCENGDLLYAWSASFGPKVWKAEKVIYHYHIWKVVPNDELVTRDFLFTLFDWDKEKIKREQGTGTTMIHVSKGSMENRLVVVPPLEQQYKIVGQLTELNCETQKLEAAYRQKLADLEGLKKSILQKAFAGELTNR